MTRMPGLPPVGRLFARSSRRRRRQQQRHCSRMVMVPHRGPHRQIASNSQGGRSRVGWASERTGRPVQTELWRSASPDILLATRVLFPMLRSRAGLSVAVNGGNQHIKLPSRLGHYGQEKGCLGQNQSPGLRKSMVLAAHARVNAGSRLLGFPVAAKAGIVYQQAPSEGHYPTFPTPWTRRHGVLEAELERMFQEPL